MASNDNKFVYLSKIFSINTSFSSKNSSLILKSLFILVWHLMQNPSLISEVLSFFPHSMHESVIILPLSSTLLAFLRMKLFILKRLVGSKLSVTPSTAALWQVLKVSLSKLSNDK